MGKIVKYCADCEEGFAEKFSFCPNCAKALTAYEMNPANANEILKVAEPVDIASDAPAETVQNTPVETVKPAEPATPVFLAKDEDLNLFDDEEFVSDEEPVSAPAENSSVIAPAVVSGATGGYSQSFNQPTEDFAAGYASNGNGASTVYQTSEPSHQVAEPTNRVKTSDGQYHITFVEDKNASGRNLLLLGAFLLVTTTVLGGITFSLFRQNPYIGSLNDNDISVVYTADTPEEIEPVKPEPKKKEDGGGGGGGGQHDQTDTSKGVLATQVEKPMIAPTAKADKVTDPAIPIQMATQGNRQEKPTNDPYGNPNSKFDIASDGMGNGGGQGNGNGRGQGNGIGTGAGNGIGSGNGNGNGPGNGNGTGSGTEGDPPKLPPPAPKVTTPLNITLKPRATYTDTARQNQVMGVIRVRVVFLANGQIGSVTPLNNLPYGLTEQAIAAAKQIKFEPQKINGVATTVTKQFEYTFSIY